MPQYQQQTLLQNSFDINNLLHSQMNDKINGQSMTDQELQQYENQLICLYQQLNPNQEVLINLLHNQQTSNHCLIDSFHFKDIFFDSLEGKQHQIIFLGSIQNQIMLEEQILKQLTRILFKIGQQEKTFYPHLLTHIKEQFYKPTILNQTDQHQFHHPQLIDIFFNQIGETPNYDLFIKINPQFQQICANVFKESSINDKKHLQIANSSQQNDSQNKTFKLIEKICKKFFIQINSFGFSNPPIHMIAIANEERFVFINESTAFFLVELQKFQLLNVRRKSSHNISVQNREFICQQTQQRKNKKKNSNDFSKIAYFGCGNPSANIFLQHPDSNLADEDQTSNYDSSFLKSQSKANQLSDESTPKFKNSSIANVRKKSHKDSFGGVDFDNLVYKDLSKPKRYVDQKSRLKDQQRNLTNIEKYNKKVFSQRFETHEMNSLTYGQDQDPEIQFLPHFQMGENTQNEKSLSLCGNSLNSPVCSAFNYANFSSFVNQTQFQNPKNILIKRMKGSNIEKSSQFFNLQGQLDIDSPKLKHKQSSKKQSEFNKPNFVGSRILTTSEIISSSDTLKDNKLKETVNQENEDFLIIPSMHSRNNIAQFHEERSLSSIPHKQVFMSFSKNDKQKFIVPDAMEKELKKTNNLENQDKNKYLGQNKLSNIQRKSFNDGSNDECNQTVIKYNYQTKKEERQKYRIKIKQERYLQSQANIEKQHTDERKKSREKSQQDSLILPYKSYSTYQNNRKGFRNDCYVHFESPSEIQCKQQQGIFTHSSNKSNNKQSWKLQRKHSSNVPVYQAVQSPQQFQHSKQPPYNLLNSRQEHHLCPKQQNLISSRQKNLVNSRQQISKRFEENSVRFSQVIDNRDDQIFYVQNKSKMQSFGTKKQRKVTDIYQGPLVNSKRGNRTSQVIQNSKDKDISSQSHHFQSHLSITQDNPNILLNSGGGKNYSVLSNISYDQEKRLQDLLEIENQILNKNSHDLQKMQSNQFINYRENHLEFANFQAIERLIFKKKLQKNKLQTSTINVSIQSKKYVLDEPENWIKKQIFYFFDSTIGISQPTLKKTIFNQKQRKQDTFASGKSINKSVYRNKDQFNSSTSLYNFSSHKTVKLETQSFKKQSDQTKTNSKSNQNLFQRKYSTQQIRPLIQNNNSNSIHSYHQFNQMHTQYQFNEIRTQGNFNEIRTKNNFNEIRTQNNFNQIKTKDKNNQIRNVYGINENLENVSNFGHSNSSSFQSYRKQVPVSLVHGNNQQLGNDYDRLSVRTSQPFQKKNQISYMKDLNTQMDKISKGGSNYINNGESNYKQKMPVIKFTWQSPTNQVQSLNKINCLQSTNNKSTQMPGKTIFYTSPISPVNNPSKINIKN